MTRTLFLATLATGLTFSWALSAEKSTSRRYEYDGVFTRQRPVGVESSECGLDVFRNDYSGGFAILSADESRVELEGFGCEIPLAKGNDVEELIHCDAFPSGNEQLPEVYVSPVAWSSEQKRIEFTGTIVQGEQKWCFSLAADLRPVD